MRSFLLGLCATLVASCALNPEAVPPDGAGAAIVADDRAEPVRDASTDAREDAALDAVADAGDGGDVDDVSDAVSRWDILLPDVVDAGRPLDAPSAPDVVAPPDVVVVDRPSVVDDRPDVVLAAPDIVVPAPDVVAAQDVVTFDRPDVVVERPDVVTFDRPDVVVERPDVVTFDRPDVVVERPDVVTFDRPDVVTVDRPDVVTLDRPDVVTVDRPDVVTLDRPDVVTVDRPDVVTVDRPDVVTVDRSDVPVFDAGSGAPSPDSVAYSGTFPVRTGVFSVTLTIAGERRTVRLAVPTSPVIAPPLVLLFHGTNGDGAQIMTEANAAALANAEGVIVAAPSSRWLPVGDFDHATEETYWETQRNTDPNSNQDVLLSRAIMVEAQRVYRVDPARIYAMGHSNGAFFSVFLATLLQDRVAAFAVNSGGLVTCARTTSCLFQGRGTTCAALATQSGWCGCAGAELPIPLATRGRRVPGYITHGTADPLVSVFYGCALQARMTALGMPVQINLFNGEGHVIPTGWAQMAYEFFRPLRLYP